VISSKVTCDTCDGNQIIHGKTCPECEGEGVVTRQSKRGSDHMQAESVDYKALVLQINQLDAEWQSIERLLGDPPSHWVDRDREAWVEKAIGIEKEKEVLLEQYPELQLDPDTDQWVVLKKPIDVPTITQGVAAGGSKIVGMVRGMSKARELMYSAPVTVDSLKWQKFPVLDDGFVCLVDVMGTDRAVVDAARISYNKDDRDARDRFQETAAKLFPKGGSSPYLAPDDFDSGHKAGHGLSPEETAKVLQALDADDRTLIRYLMRHRHTTPFEMAELKFLVRVPMDCWRQWIRHRTANVNEYSTRYTEAIDSQQKTPAEEWRLQSGGNRQGSAGTLRKEWPALDELDRETFRFRCESDFTSPTFEAGPGDYLSHQEGKFHSQARMLYEDRLTLGIAREQARKDLPLSTYTEAYWKIDLHNLLHFLGLRMDSHAQHEIRQYATIIGEQIVKPLFPMVWEAFEDYRLGAMTLSKVEVECISAWTGNSKEVDPPVLETWFPNKREREEFQAKMGRLGIL